jgi:hypothetical protein
MARATTWRAAGLAVAPARWVVIASAVGAVVVGLLTVAMFFGPGILPPSHTGWMLSGNIGPDPVQYWLGWTFFRDTPWTWPPGLNPGWGMELSSSIFFADAIPLLAFAFKALRAVVEVPQYWGMWIYACAALQGFMAWRILGLATSDPLARLAGAALFVLQPAMLARMGGHFALSAHFLLLIGLWLCLTQAAPARRLVQWAALFGATALIHSYFLPMIGALWLADLLGRATDPARRKPLWLAAEIPLAPGTGIAGLWLAGFFLLSDDFGGSWGGYGLMQLDLLAPFDPGSWGVFLPDLPGATHLEAGRSYLGLGALLLLAIGAVAWVRRPAPVLRRHWALLAAMVGLAAFAVTHRVSVGGHVFELFALPPEILRYADALRASERFVWPVFYALLIAAVFALVRGLGGRRAGLVLLLLALVQAADLRGGVRWLRPYFPPTEATVPLRLSDPFWAEAAGRYDAIRIVPSGNQAHWWEEVAVYAATMGLSTDAVYLARLDGRRVAALNAEMARRLSEGDFEPGTLYVLADEGAIILARASADPARDLIGSFNGLTVLAPGWFAGAPRSRAPGG